MNSQPHIALLHSRIRVEEKLLLRAFEAQGVSVDLFDSFDL